MQKKEEGRIKRSRGNGTSLCQNIIVNNNRSIKSLYNLEGYVLRL